MFSCGSLLKEVDSRAENADIAGMSTYAHAIGYITYNFMGHEVTDKVLLLESDGQCHAHALLINCMGTGHNYAEALESLEMIVADFIQTVTSEPDKYVIGPAPESFFKIWEKIRESTEAESLDLAVISRNPSEIRIPVVA